MVTRVGDRLVYDNIKMGAAKNEAEPEEIYLIFTDKDNEEMHMVPVSISKLEQYFNLVRQTAAGQKIEIASASDLPRGVS
jgi:hypothetical protein